MVSRARFQTAVPRRSCAPSYSSTLTPLPCGPSSQSRCALNALQWYMDRHGGSILCVSNSNDHTLELARFSHAKWGRRESERDETFWGTFQHPLSLARLVVTWTRWTGALRTYGRRPSMADDVCTFPYLDKLLVTSRLSCNIVGSSIPMRFLILLLSFECAGRDGSIGNIHQATSGRGDHQRPHQ